MGIQIQTIRIAGLRGLQNIEVDLCPTTVLTGMNNTGKTTLLKALQIAFGNRLFITSDDFNITAGDNSDFIIVDVLIIPLDDDGNRAENFDDEWESLFTEKRISIDSDGNYFAAFRTKVSFDDISSSYRSVQNTLIEWPLFIDSDDIFWFDASTGNEINFHFDEIPFFYIDAQRDIIEDVKLKNSFLGKMISKIEYEKEDAVEIEEKIKELNEKVMESSEILTNIKNSLKELDSAMGSNGEGVEITPFTKKIRDLNKGLSIYYSDQDDSFSMEYHGMGTRSWSSLLTLKSFIKHLAANADKKGRPFFPVLAIEEPEAHLHPNAQKKLYTQIAEIAGQKIISTHSPYIAACAELTQIRSLYKDADSVHCGQVDTTGWSDEDIRKIKRQVIATRGEIFFSKVIVLFEGETEEQALPIFAEHHFRKTPVELGIDFVGVGGFGKYLPFIRLADSLEIPWLILSDCEENVEESVKAQFEAAETNENFSDRIIFLSKGKNFESQMIADGFSKEIKEVVLSVELPKCKNEKHEAAKKIEVKNYTDAKLFEIIDGAKAQYGPLIAEKIIASGKGLPAKITELFVKIKELLNREKTDD